MERYKIQKIIIILILLISSLLSGCGTQPTVEKQTLHITIREYNVHTGTYFRKLGDEYMRVHPNVVVNTEIIPWESTKDRMETWKETGLTPDITNIPTIDLPQYVEQNLAASLNQFTTMNFIKDFYPSLLDDNRLDGEIRGLPFALAVQSMYINNKIFNDLKLTAPKSWEEFIQTAQKIQKPPQVYAFGIDGKDMEMCNLFLYLYWSKGGDFIGESGNIQINRAVAIDSLEDILELMYRYKITQPDPIDTSLEDLQDLFKNNQLAMIITGSWFINNLQLEQPDLDYKVISLPNMKEPVGLGNSDSLILLQSSIIKKTAWDYIRYMYHVKNKSEFDKIHGMVPVTQSVSKDPYYKDNPNRKIFIDQVPYIKLIPFIKNKKQIVIEINHALKSAYSKKTSSSQAIDGLINALGKNIQ